MIKRVLFFLLFFLVLLSISPETDVSGDATNDKKREKLFDFIFYAEDRVIFESYPDYITDLSYSNELNLELLFKKRFYTLDTYLNNIFQFNFLPALYPGYYVPYKFSYENIEFAVLNKFKIQRVMDVLLNTYLAFYIPFDYYLSIYLTLENELKGNYYFGLFWGNRLAFTPEFIPQVSDITLAVEDQIVLGYEFFRFYGPKVFKLAILLDNTFNFLFKDVIYYINELKAGTYLTFFNSVKLYLYFILIDQYIFDYSFLNENSIGINAIFEFYKRYFLLYIEYKGTIDTTIKPYSWKNWIELSFRFMLN